LARKHKILPYDKYKEPFTSRRNLEALASGAEVAFICVPTPMKPSGEIDYSPIYNSLQLLTDTTRDVKRNPGELLVVIRSTAVSGTTDELATAYPFKFAFNPEFLRERHALKDMQSTDRVILGVEDDASREKLLRVYKPVFPKAKYFVTDRKTAEMVKYAANVFLTMQIAMGNEMYQICQAVGVDYNAVKKIVLNDQRIGRNLDVPGPDGDFGFGGKCFPKDLNALIHYARSRQYRPYFLEEAWRLNERVRKNKDWLDIPGATSGNQNFRKK
jgi:UDPglucose 6-dehydrogenase